MITIIRDMSSFSHDASFPNSRRSSFLDRSTLVRHEPTSFNSNNKSNDDNDKNDNSKERGKKNNNKALKN